MAIGASLNTVSCISGAINTNMGSCSFDPKNFVGAFLCPAGYVIPSAVFNGSYLTIAGTPVATPSASGGTIAAGTYYYKITALNAAGESLPSTETSATTTGSTSSVVLTWTATAGATSYKIYKGSTAGGEANYFTSTSPTYTDTGTAGTSGTPPAVNTAFVAALSTALQTQLTADSRADNPALRIYPVPNFFNFKDSSEKAVEQKFDYGQVQTVRDGIMDWQFEFRLGGLNLSNALRGYNGYAWSFLFIDSKNQLVGTQATDSLGIATIGAISPIEFYQDPFVPNDGKKLATYLSKFRFLATYVNELVAYVTTAPFNIVSVITGLIDVVLTGAESSTPGTYNVTVTSRVGGVNIGALYSTALASASLWVANNTITGTTIAITGVTWNAAGGYFALALTVTSPPYPAIGAQLNINTVGPTELAAALVPGYCSTGAVTITRAV
jgi:hypothetical protein